MADLPTHAHRSPMGALPAAARIPAIRNRLPARLTATWTPRERPTGIPGWLKPAETGSGL